MAKKEVVITTEVQLRKLEKDDHVSWKWQFKNVLRAKKLDSVLSDSETKESDKDYQVLAPLGSTWSHMTGVM